jgi:23S rRNA pseudouridine2605 synthase
VLAQPKRTHLNRALSKLGLCSRGVADRWIAEGRVTVNGIRAEDAEQWVELGTDHIEVDSQAGPASEADGAGPAPADAPAARAHLYLALHKPVGYVTTRSDELGRKTVYDLLPAQAVGGAASGGWLFPVGRLDLESEGLLLMTDDGGWADLLTAPEFHVPKTYRVKLDRKPLPGDLERFRAGIPLDGALTLPAQAEPEESGAWCRVVLTEGRNRQIRRMFHALGYKVKRLVRISIGPLGLGDLAPGSARPLLDGEVAALRMAARSGPV